MEVESIINLISQNAFPIAACIVMWRYLTTVTTELRKSIDCNTRAVERMSDKLDSLEKIKDELREEMKKNAGNMEQIVGCTW